MRGISKAETKALVAEHDGLPEHLKRRFKPVVINGAAKMNTSAKTCHHCINGGPCIVRVNKMIRAKNYNTDKTSFYWEDGQIFVRRAGTQIIHEGWGNHQPFADVEEEEQLAHLGVEKHSIEYETVLKTRRDAGAMSRSIWLSAQASGDSEFPIGYEGNEYLPEEPGCLFVTTIKGKVAFIPCPFHTGFSVLRLARKHNPDPRHVAKQMLGFCLWPLKPADHELPKVGVPWSYDNLQTWRTKVTARTIFNKKFRKMDSKTAGGKAFGYLNHQYPDAKLYLSHEENIKIPDELRYEIQREDWLILRRAGIDVGGSVIKPGANALRVYRELSHSLLASCPHTTNPGDGFGSMVLAHLAIDQNLRERTAKKEDFSDDKSRVQIITGDLAPGALFNSFDLDTRMWLLCGNKECTKDCIQHRLFNIKRDVNNLRVLSIGMETLLRDHDSEMVSEVAIGLEGAQEKRKAISGMEEDLWRTSHDIIREAMEMRSKADLKAIGPDQFEVEDGLDVLNHNVTNNTGYSLDPTLVCEATVNDLQVRNMKDFFTIGVTKEVDDEGGIHHRKMYGPHKVKTYKVKLKTGYLYDFKVRDWVVKDNAVTPAWVKQDKAWWAMRAKQNKALVKKYPYEPRVPFKPTHGSPMKASYTEEPFTTTDYTGRQPHRYTLWSSFCAEQELKRKHTKRKAWTVAEFFENFDYCERKPGR
jgi:hypothetical protein